MRKEDKEFLEKIGVELDDIPAQRTKHPDKSKTLVLADLHAPYHCRKTIDAAIAAHGDAQTLFIPGDLGDYYSKSRFRKTKYVSFKDELRSVFLLLQEFSAKFHIVKVMQGNHDNRPEKLLAALLDGHADLLTLTELNVLKRICKFFPNVQFVGHRVPHSNILLPHIYQCGDIIYTHIEISREQDTAVLGRISLQLHRWKERLGLKPFHVICQAHNHNALKSFKGGEVWYQVPCASNQFSLGMEYIYNSRMVGTPSATGYAVVYQDSRGITDINKSNWYLV
jgi:hypothetical protein